MTRAVKSGTEERSFLVWTRWKWECGKGRERAEVLMVSREFDQDDLEESRRYGDSSLVVKDTARCNRVIWKR